MTSVPPSFQHPGSPPSRPELPEGVAPPEPPEAMPRLGVPLWSPFLVVLAAFITVLAVQIVVVTIAELTGGDANEISGTDAATIGFTFVLDISLVALTVAAVWWLRAGRPSPAAFGLLVPRWPSALAWTFAAYVSFIVLGGLAGLLLGDPEEQDIVAELKAEDSVLVLTGFGIMTCFLAPLAEEFFFRGFLFRVLHEKTNLVIGVLVGGIAFGLVHLPSGDWIGTIVLSLFGMALCVLFYLTSSLLPCIMLHAFHNSISFGFTKELPWWGFLLLIVASVTTTLAIARLASVRAQPAPG
jgi:membrane protease YdiL (CAAX protease family)